MVALPRVSWPQTLALLSLLPLAAPLYFHIGETERKCFIEEIPDETMVIGETEAGSAQSEIAPFISCSSL